MAQLSSRLVISLVDRVSGPARGVANSLRTLHRDSSSLVAVGRNLRTAGDHFTRFGATALGAGYGLQAIINPTREFNDAVWGTTAALIGQTNALKPAQEQSEKLRRTAIDLSKRYGLMPEIFAKAGEEAAKMGLSYKRTEAVMTAAGKVFMSDREANPSDIAKALGTYGIIYGAAEGDDAYNAQVAGRASALALAGAKTRTSASKIEEGARNYMGVHGAFGGRFEDMVALIAAGSQTGLFEKESGTALKSLTARFLRMPAEGRAGLAASGIDISKFMDFSAADPTRARKQIIEAFPGAFKKGANGRVQKFLEKAQRDGRLKDPAIINETLQFLEKQGLQFAGAEDRDAGAAKIAAILHGAGGNFDPLALFSEVQKAIDEGRAGPGLMAAIGEPKRLHQYLALLKVLADAKVLRDELVQDQGRFLELVAEGYRESDAGKIVAMEAAWRRFSLALVRSQGLQTFVSTLANIGEWFASAPSWMQDGIGWFLALGAAIVPLGFALRGILSTLQAIGGLLGLLGLGRIAAGAGGAGAAGAGLAEIFGLGAAGAVAGTKGGKLVANGMSLSGKDADNKRIGQKIAEGMSGGGAGGGAAKGGGWLSKLWRVGKAGAKAIPFLGSAIALYGIYEALWGDDAEAAGVPTPGRTVADAGGVVARGKPPPGVHYQPDEENKPSKFDAQPDTGPIVNGVNGAMNQVRAIVAGVDLTAEGTRIAQSLANGIKAGIPAIQSAASQAAAAASRSALRGAYTDGGR